MNYHTAVQPTLLAGLVVAEVEVFFSGLASVPVLALFGLVSVLSLEAAVVPAGLAVATRVGFGTLGLEIDLAGLAGGFGSE